MKTKTEEEEECTLCDSYTDTKDVCPQCEGTGKIEKNSMAPHPVLLVGHKGNK